MWDDIVEKGKERVLSVSVGFRMLCASYIPVGLSTLLLPSPRKLVAQCFHLQNWTCVAQDPAHPERDEPCFGKIALLVRASEVRGCRTWVVDKTMVQERGKEE